MLKKVSGWFKSIKPINKLIAGFSIFFLLSMLSIWIYDQPLGNLIIDALPKGLDEVTRILLWAICIIASAMILWKVLVVWVIKPIISIRKGKGQKEKSPSDQEKKD